MHTTDQTTSTSTRLEWAAVLGLFVAALLLRLANLGGPLMGDAEARLALQAAEWLRAIPADLAGQPLYLSLTSLIMLLFGENNLAARLLPALTGAGMVWLPLLWRSRLGRTGTLALSAILAFDPGLTALSRTAGSDLLAVAAAAGLLAALTYRSALWSGVCTALLLLSGPAGWLFGLTGGLGALIVWRWSPGEHAAPLPVIDWRSAIWPFALTVLIPATLLGLAPHGLGALANTLPELAGRYFTPSGFSLAAVIIGLLVYAALPLLFSFVFLSLQGRTLNTAGRWLAFITAINLVLVLLLPGRQMSDLIWVILPAWILSLPIIEQIIEAARARSLTIWLHAALITVLLLLAWLNLAGLAGQSVENFLAGLTTPGTLDIPSARLLLLIGLLLLGTVASLLIGLGWSWQLAGRGAGLGMLIALGIFTLGSTWGVAMVRPQQAGEWWYAGWQPSGASLVMETVARLSEWRTGREDSLDVLLVGAPPSLVWALRDFPQTQSVGVMPQSGVPSLIIAPQGIPEPALSVGYRGQDLTWSGRTGSMDLGFSEWTDWLAFRNYPLEQQVWTLWARADVFPGGVLLPEIPADTANPPVEDELPADSPLQ